MAAAQAATWVSLVDRMAGATRGLALQEGVVRCWPGRGRVFGHRCDAQDDGFAHSKENCAAGLLSHATCLEVELLSAYLEFECVYHLCSVKINGA